MDDPDARLLGDAEVVVRVCDFYAWLVSQPYGAPQFSFSWDQGRRNRAIAEIREYIAAYGSARPAAP